VIATESENIDQNTLTNLHLVWPLACPALTDAATSSPNTVNTLLVETLIYKNYTQTALIKLLLFSNHTNTIECHTIQNDGNVPFSSIHPFIKSCA